MAALKELLTGGWSIKAKLAQSRVSASFPTPYYSGEEMQHMLGEYRADYTLPTEKQLAEADPEMDAVIQRSIVVSAKRGL